MFSVDWKDVAVGLLAAIIVADVLLAYFYDYRANVVSAVIGSLKDENGMIILGAAIVAGFVGYAFAKRSKGEIDV